jgi:hypothetical protein
MNSGNRFIGSQSASALMDRSHLVSIFVVAVARAKKFPTTSILAGNPGRLNLPNRPRLLKIKDNGKS